MKARLASFLLLFTLACSWPAQAMDDGLQSLRQTGKAFASVARAVSPSVVYIQAESGTPAAAVTRPSSPFGDDLFKRFFGERFQGRPRGQAPLLKQTGPSW